MEITNGVIRATLDEIDNSRWVDPKANQSISFMFEDEHTLVIDVHQKCNFDKDDPNHEECQVETITINLL